MRAIKFFNCTDFRGYTIRKRFGYELEERFKRILNNYDNIHDGLKALLREGLKHEDAAFIVQRWYKKEEKAVRKKPPPRDPVHPKLRQADLIQFSQNVIKNFRILILNQAEILSCLKLELNYNLFFFLDIIQNCIKRSFLIKRKLIQLNYYYQISCDCTFLSR